MLKYKFFIYILLFITFVSCRYRQNVTDKKVSIFYFTGNIDTYRQLECEDIEKFSENTKYDDTLFVKKYVIEQVSQKIKYAKRDTSRCYTNDSPIIYVDIHGMKLCINAKGNICWIKKHGRYELYKISDKVAYLLKCNSNYYNNMSMNDLFNDYGIKKYGIPNGYKDINARKDSKRKESYKILVYFN